MAGNGRHGARQWDRPLPSQRVHGEREGDDRQQQDRGDETRMRAPSAVRAEKTGNQVDDGREEVTHRRKASRHHAPRRAASSPRERTPTFA